MPRQPAYAATPERATEADKRHKGWWRRRIYWTPELRAKVDPYLCQYAPMVRGVAIRVRRRFPSVEFDDLLSEGTYALARCAIGFEPSRGVRFTTFAIPAVHRAVRNKAKRILRTRQRTEHPTVCLDKPSLTEFVGQEGSVLSQLADAEDGSAAVEWIRERLAVMPERDRLILMLRMEGMTLEAIGQDARVGRTREGVRKIVEQRMAALTEAWQRRGRDER